MGDASAIGPRNDEQLGSRSQSLRPVDEVLRRRERASRKGVIRDVTVRNALTVEQMFEPWFNHDRLSSMLSALARKHQVPGAQLAIHQDGETVAVEVGELQYGTGRPVTRDAAFPIGSITKTFTATLAMILVADGDLELDAPLSEYVPELGDLGDELTLRQLMSHTGGLDVGPGPREVLTTSIRRHAIEHCCRQNLVLPPGTAFSYSNMGYVLVGHLIETITGMSWWDALESILLRPLGIESTFVCTPGRRPSGRPLAMGHSVNTALGRIRPVTQSLSSAAAPAGGLAVSAVDLVTLALTQLGGRPALLPAAYAEQMRQAVPGAEPLGSADGWGLGLAVFGNGNTAWLGHFGVMEGADCNVRLNPFSGCVVAFTSNANPGGMWHELVHELRKADLSIMDGSSTESRGRPAAPPPGCVGSYVNGKTELLVELTDTGTLSLAVNGGLANELIVFDDLTFSYREQPWIRGRFLRDPFTGDFEQIQANLYAARRQSTADEKLRRSTEAQAAFV